MNNDFDANDRKNDPVEELERKTSAFMSKIREEAALIIEDAKQQVELLKVETSKLLQKERDELERRAADLDLARKTLEDDFNTLEERRLALENDSFERAREEGYKQGVIDGTADGYRSGEQKASDEFDSKVAQQVELQIKAISETALEPLRKLVKEMSESRQALLKNWQENILQIAAAIAYQTILREPTIMREAPIDLLREALELAMNCASLKIRMNPDDVELLNEQISFVLEETGNIAKSEVISDPKITRGGCLVETSLGIVDERLETRLERIVSELSE